MLRVVIDTSVLISNLWGGHSRKVISLWGENRIKLLVSDTIVKEYLSVLSRFVTPEHLRNWAFLFTHPKKVTRIQPKEEYKACRDEDDNKFLDTAVAGKADYIVARDLDLVEMRIFKRIKILTPGRFLEEIER